MPVFAERRKEGRKRIWIPFYMLFLGTAQKIFFKLMLLSMSKYIFLINQVQVLFFIPLFFLCSSWYQRLNGAAAQMNRNDKTISKRIRLLIIFIGVLEIMNMLLQLISGA
jgi:hypothetical protein